MKNQQKMNRKS